MKLRHLFQIAGACAIALIVCGCEELPPSAQEPLAGRFPWQAQPSGFWNDEGASGPPKIIVHIGEQKAYFYKGTFVKVSLLFADMYDDLGWPGGALVIPKAGRLGLPRKTSGQWLLGGRWEFFATANDERDGARACDLEQMAKFHGAAADTFVWVWRIQSQI